jgi:hypothetical protein
MPKPRDSNCIDAEMHPGGAVGPGRVGVGTDAVGLGIEGVGTDDGAGTTP